MHAILIGILLLSGLSIFYFSIWHKLKYRGTSLLEAEERFATMFECTNTGIALLHLDGRIIRVNQALCELLGFNPEEMLSKNFYFLIHPNDWGHLQANAQRLIENRLRLYQAEQQCFKKDGEAVWVALTLSAMRNKNQAMYFVVQVQNISLQKKAEERLKHMAYHDPLTGLANRHRLEQFIQHLLASSTRQKQEFALLFLDLDRFKYVNDSIGHEAGDLLLQIVADRLRSVVRSTDVVARLGGDEFVLVIGDVKKTESLALIAQKILEKIMQAIVIKGQEIYITTSVGISLYPYDGQSLPELMTNADLALYRAKEHGRNNYQFYTVEMTSMAQNKLALQNALGHALAQGEFILYYLPRMNLSTRRITGVEALLRWENQNFATITPSEIISLAEENGLIIPVSEWILKTACAQLKKWHEMGMMELTVTINGTPKLFKQNNFIDNTMRFVQEAGLALSAVEFEITERSMLDDPENILRVLHELKLQGIGIAIDDFGTGNWSLSNLRHLSVDRIKIDSTFVRQVTLDETSAVMTSAIITMVNKLGVISVAEGVETLEQCEFLQKEHCTEIQGYYLSKPLAAKEITEFLKSRMASQIPLP